MVDVLTLELNVAQLVAQGARTNEILEQIAERGVRAASSTDRLTQSVTGGTRALGSFTVNSLQAVNNMANLARSLTSIANGTTSFAQGISSAGVELGLLAGNLIHMAQASQLATGQAGIGGLFSALIRNPFVVVTGGIIALTQAIALFSGGATTARDKADDLSRAFSGLRSGGRTAGNRVDDLVRLQQAFDQKPLITFNPATGKTLTDEELIPFLRSSPSNQIAIQDLSRFPGINRGVLGSRFRGQDAITLQELQESIDDLIASELSKQRSELYGRIGEDNSFALLDPRARRVKEVGRHFMDRYQDPEVAGFAERSEQFRQQAQDMRELSDDLARSLSSLLSVDAWNDWRQAGINALKGVVNALNEAFIQKPLTNALSNVFASVFSPAPPGGIR